MLPTSIRYFLEAVQHGSIRRAAEGLSVAPSAISRQLTKLELELDVLLLERRSNGIILTDAGRLLLAYAQRSEEQLTSLRREIRELASNFGGSVHIASVEGMISYFLSKYIGLFEKEYPNVKVYASIVGAQSVLEDLREMRVDMALAFGVSPAKGFVQHAQLKQPLCAIVAVDHPLVRKKTVSLVELSGMRVVLPNSSFAIRALVDSVSKRKKVEFQQIVETNSLEITKGVVRNSRLVTFLPRYAALREIAARELHAIALSDRPLTDTTVALLTSRSHRLSSISLAFLNKIKFGMATYNRNS